MTANLHVTCFYASCFSHNTLNDRLHADAYRYGMDIKKESGRRLREAREAKEWTLADVGKRVPGLTPSRLSNWEQGTRTIPNDWAIRLGELYGVRPAWLTALDNDKGDPRKIALVSYYDMSDERGKQAILRAAESESHYGPEDDTAATNAAKQ